MTQKQHTSSLTSETLNAIDKASDKFILITLHDNNTTHLVHHYNTKDMSVDDMLKLNSRYIVTIIRSLHKATKESVLNNAYEATMKRLTQFVEYGLEQLKD